MMLSWNRKSIAAGLGLAAVLVFNVAGCGGKGPEQSDAVVVTEPGVNLPTAGAAPAAAGSSAAPTPAAVASTSAPSAAVKSEGWGTLKGQVTFGSNPPATEILVDKGKAPKDPEVCAKADSIPSERLVVDGASKGVEYVIVYIPKPTAVNDDAKKAAAETTVDFDQVNCIFKPHVLALMTNSKITLKSSDPVNHNVNAKLKNSPFNSLLAAGQSTAFTPSAAERSPGEVTCDIHPWMKAWWLVLDSPYFAVTDAKGNYEIKNAPAGTQKVVVWQEAVTKGGFVTASSGDEVTIKANDTTEKNFTIDPGKILPSK